MCCEYGGFFVLWSCESVQIFDSLYDMKFFDLLMKFVGFLLREYFESMFIYCYFFKVFN